MARQTAAERKAQLAEQQAKDLAEFNKDLMQRNLELLAKATQLGGFDFGVTQQLEFNVTWTDEYNHRERAVLFTEVTEHRFLWPAREAFDNLERAVEAEVERRAEEQRRRELRQSALNKLSDEERQALGV